MECLTWIFSFDIFLYHYFISFSRLTHLGVNIQATVVLNKNRLPKCTSTVDKQLQKRNLVILNSTRHTYQKTVWLMLLLRMTVGGGLPFSESCQPKRFVWCWNKVERTYIQEQQPNQFHCYNQNMGFVNRMDQNVAKYRIGIEMRKWWWFPFAWVVGVALQGAWVLHCIN